MRSTVVTVVDHLAFIILFSFSIVSSQELPEAQYLALYDLYTTTGGDSWLWSTPYTEYGYPWQFSGDADPCTDDWQGVTCSNATGTQSIITLDLYDCNLAGFIPSSIGNLAGLQYLDLGYNTITGTLPSTLDNLRQLTTLSVHDTSVNGSLPSLGNLAQLQDLALFSNQLTGTIPASFCQLTELVNLAVNFNFDLYGTIPSCLSSLTKLGSLSLQNNLLTGTIPAFLGQLTQLTVLHLDANSFNGTIPSSLGNLSRLTLLFTNYNELTGTLPSSLSQLSQVQTLYLDNNYIRGRIPDSYGNMSSLAQLSLSSNLLTGPIPESMCQLRLLEGMHLQGNYLSSSIPACIGNMKALINLNLEINYLDGPFPDSFTNLTNFASLILSVNHLTGTIPELYNMSKLNNLYLIHNRFSGSLPSSIWQLESLVLLYANENHFYGALPNFTDDAARLLQHVNLSSNNFYGAVPESIGLLTDLVVLCVSDNSLTGTIPASISALPLAQLDLSRNALSGTIPSTFVELTNMVSLALHSNKLVGSLDGVFNTSWTKLITLQLDENEFTGTLPSALFDLPALVALTIVGSCLEGTLPGNICGATSLQALVLYGLTTGDSCRTTGVDALSVVQHAFGGPFPRCVLELPTLRTLLLASNGLTGRMDDSWEVSQSFLQLDLSHNLLSGSISSSIQNHSWGILDLSHNKLSGVLEADFFPVLNLTVQYLFNPIIVEISKRINYSTTLPIPASTLNLDTNRLSGLVPNHVKPLAAVNVLAGNLFQCRYDKSDLPQHDTDIDNYECASNSFDLSIYLWLGLVLVVPALLVVYVRCVAPEWRWPDLLLDSASAVRLPMLLHVQTVFAATVKTGACCAVFCMLVLMPYYVVASVYRGTHTHQYAYILSAIYTSGALVFALDFVLWTALLVIVVFLYRACMQDASSKQLGATEAAAITSATERAYVWVLFAVFNTAAVLGVNVAFVYTVLYQSTEVQTAAQVLLSLFKLGWSTAVSPWMIRQLDGYFISVREGPAEPFFTLQLLVALFNNIAIPCLVVMAVDPNCFSEILLPPSSESVDFLLPVCAEQLQQGSSCTNIFYSRSSLRFNPPFTYSYQCSSSFITSYAPTFVFMSIATVFFSPVLRYGLRKFHARLAVESRAHAVSSAIIPRILQSPSLVAQVPHAGGKRERPLFRAVGILVGLLMQLGVLLTFGAIFPPVALAMAVSIVATVYTARWELRRFIQATLDVHYLHCLGAVDFECSEVGTSEQLRTAVMLIVCFCCAFYTLFLFDTLGDAEGFDASVWVLIVVPLSPVLLFVSLYAYNVWASPVVVQEDPASIEMKTVADTNTCEADLPTLNVLHPALV